VKSHAIISSKASKGIHKANIHPNNLNMVALAVPLLPSTEILRSLQLAKVLPGPMLNSPEEPKASVVSGAWLSELQPVASWDTKPDIMACWVHWVVLSLPVW
jgi:hypothetical protein